MAKTESDVSLEFLQAFSDNMTNPINMDKLGIGYKTFKEGAIIEGNNLVVYNPNKPYGMLWNDIDDTYFRLGHNIPTVQQKIKRCVTLGNPQFGGSVYKYLNPDNSNLFEDGADASAYVSDATGAYNVMVEIPKCYILRYKENELNFRWMSIENFDGASTDKAFRMSGWTDTGDGTDVDHEADFTYISAFEGVLYDSSVASCIDGIATTPTLDLLADKLVSTAGYKPNSTVSIAEGRTMIANGGGKQFDWHRYSLMRMCFEVEYLTQDSQTAIPGYTEFTSGASYDAGVVRTGITLSLGNHSGSVTGLASDNGGTDTTSRVISNSYRGIENFYGHLWQWTDGINISDYIPWICGIDDIFTSDKFEAPYVSTNHIQPNVNGYQSKVTADFLVEAVGATATTKVTDYYYQASGDRVLRSGGGLASSSAAGVSSLHAYDSSSVVYWIICSRL